jgi:hypothetical protein
LLVLHLPDHDVIRSGSHAAAAGYACGRTRIPGERTPWQRLL